MDWRDVSNVIGDAAPLVGKLLSIPGAGIDGELLGRVLSTEPTPEKVLTALQSDPDWAVKVKKLELDHEQELTRLHLNAEAAQLAQINRTMRAEAGSKWWMQAAWRPFWGFISALAFLLLVIGVVIIAGRAVWSGDWEMLKYIPDLVTSTAMLFGTPAAILGVASWHRGKEKRILAGETAAPGLLGVIAKKLAG